MTVRAHAGIGRTESRWVFRGNVSGNNLATNNPEQAVKPPTAPIAIPMPNASAKSGSGTFG